ncbi:MAG: biotin--[acetyl-CoA-carboxylase] ligase [Candidatus Hodarchaeales archaeon]|jgi:BirA family biotin operon repressor/biotin-[acetyl-CoA-carboxylase] ligase
MVKQITFNFLKELEFNSKICSSIYTYSEVGSTNNIARAIMLKNNQKNFAVVAEVQTSGYGRKRNLWESPLGGLWSSLVIKPSFELSYIGLIPSLCALSVAKTLKEYKIDTRLKWPNDILFLGDNKKIGGILVEGKVSLIKMDYLIIGIGLNVNNNLNQFSPPLQNKLTSTYLVKNEEISVLELYKKILINLESGLMNINSSGGEIILAEWKNWANILGSRLKITSNNIQYEGIAQDISNDGRLIIKMDNGRLIKFASGDVNLLASKS